MQVNRRTTIIPTIFVLLLSLAPLVKLNGQPMPYKNPKLSTEQRVKDLLSRMTIEEKVNQMLKVNLGELKQDEHGEITEASLEKLFKGKVLDASTTAMGRLDRYTHRCSGYSQVFGSRRQVPQKKRGWASRPYR